MFKSVNAVKFPVNTLKIMTNLCCKLLESNELYLKKNQFSEPRHMTSMSGYSFAGKRYALIFVLILVKVKLTMSSCLIAFIIHD